MSRPSVAVSIRSPNSLATLWKTSSVLSDLDRASTGFSSCRSPVDPWLLNFLRTLGFPLALNSTSRFAQVLPQGDWSNSSEHQSVIEEQKGEISRLAGDEDPVVDPASAGERQADHSEADPELDGEAKLDPDRVDGTGVSNVNVEIDIAHANQEAEESETAASPGADSTIPGHARVDSPDTPAQGGDQHRGPNPDSAKAPYNRDSPVSGRDARPDRSAPEEGGSQLSFVQEGDAPLAATAAPGPVESEGITSAEGPGDPENDHASRISQRPKRFLRG